MAGRPIRPGVFIHEIGGIETHVHLAVSIPPTILISEMAGQLKGASSHETNKEFNRKVLEWQAGYGVVSFGTKGLEWVKAYIRSQREHHAASKVHERLVRIGSREEQPAEA